MEVKVEVDNAGEQGPYYEQAEEGVAVLPLDAEGTRTKVPTLDDVLDADELEVLTAEGLAANPEETPEQTAASLERAKQMEAYQNFLKQRMFQELLSRRPMPATARTLDWALLRYEIIVHEQKEFLFKDEIAALSELQWYHGILTGNIRVIQLPPIDGGDEPRIDVELVVPYDRHTLQLKYTPEQLAAQEIARVAKQARAQRRKQ